jgi:hypothetical protein
MLAAQSVAHCEFTREAFIEKIFLCKSADSGQICLAYDIYFDFNKRNAEQVLDEGYSLES